MKSHPLFRKIHQRVDLSPLYPAVFKTSCKKGLGFDLQYSKNSFSFSDITRPTFSSSYTYANQFLSKYSKDSIFFSLDRPSSLISFDFRKKTFDFLYPLSKESILAEISNSEVSIYHSFPLSKKENHTFFFFERWSKKKGFEFGCSYAHDKLDINIFTRVKSLTTFLSLRKTALLYNDHYSQPMKILSSFYFITQKSLSCIKSSFYYDVPFFYFKACLAPFLDFSHGNLGLECYVLFNSKHFRFGLGHSDSDIATITTKIRMWGFSCGYKFSFPDMTYQVQQKLDSCHNFSISKKFNSNFKIGVKLQDPQDPKNQGLCFILKYNPKQ